MAFDPTSAVAEEPAAFDPASATPLTSARLTAYTRFDDGPEYHDGRTAAANPSSGQAKAVEGVTIAVDPALIPYGSQVRIPRLAQFSLNGDGIFTAHDTGGAVKSRKASNGREPIIDVFVDGADQEQAQKRRDALAAALGTDPLDYEIVQPAAAPAFDPSTAEEAETNWLSNAVRRGSHAARQAMEMRKPEPIPTTIAALNRLDEEVPASPEYQAFTNAPTVGDALKNFAAAPGQIMGELVAESMASMLITGAQIVPGAAATGATFGAGVGTLVAPGPGTIAGLSSGARGGAVVGVGETSLALESSGKILDSLREKGIDPTDDKALAAAFDNPELMSEARGLALRKGVPVAIFDGVSALIGGRLFSAPAKTILGKLAHGGAELGTQAALGMAGETAGELAAGEKLQPGAIMAEGIGELGPGSVEVAAGLASRPRPAAATAPAFDPSTAVPEAEPSDLAAVSLGEEAEVRAEDPLAVPAPAPAGPASPFSEERELRRFLYQVHGYPSEKLQTMSLEELRAAKAATTAATPAAGTVPATAAAAAPTPAAPPQNSPAETSEPSEPAPAPQRKPADGLSAAQRAEQDRMRQQAEAEQLEALDEIPGATKFSDALRQAGWLPSHTNEAGADFRGELQRLAEFAEARKSSKRERSSTAARLFTGTRSLDHVAEILREAGFATYGPDDVLAMAEDYLATGTDPIAFGESIAEDLEANPFAKQAGAAGTAARVDTEETIRLRKLIKEQWRTLGERQGAPVIIVPDVDSIPAQLSGEQARAAVASGSIVEAYFVSGGRQPRRIVIVRDGAAKVAAQRGMTLEKRVQQLAVHELVHHYGSLGALLPKAHQRSYNSVIDGVIARLQKTDQELLAYLTKPQWQGGYGFDLGNAKDRADLVEEYLARQHESTKAPAGWVAKVIAQIKEILRAAFPKLAWSDADIRALLDQARRKTETATEAQGTERQGEAKQSRGPLGTAADYQAEAARIWEQAGAVAFKSSSDALAVNTPAAEHLPEGQIAEVQRVYRELVRETGFPAVPIGDLMERVGFAPGDPMARAKGILAAMNQRGLANFAAGDWSLSDDRTRAWAVLRRGEIHTLVRLTDKAAVPAPAPHEMPRLSAELLQVGLDAGLTRGETIKRIAQAAEARGLRQHADTQTPEDYRALIAALREDLARPLVQGTLFSKQAIEQARQDFGTAEEVLAGATDERGKVHLNGDTIIATHPSVQAAMAARAPIAEVNALYDQLYPSAVIMRDAALRTALAQPVTEANALVILTGGGPGSGKSRSLRAETTPAIIYDTNLRNPAAARAWIEEITASGREALILYVHRDFADAVRGNLQRAENERRLSTAENIAAGHQQARASALSLVELDGQPGVTVRVMHNVQGADPVQLSLEDFAALPRPSVDELVREAHTIADATERDAQASPDALAIFRRGPEPGGSLPAVSAEELRQPGEGSGAAPGAAEPGAAGARDLVTEEEARELSAEAALAAGLATRPASHRVRMSAQAAQKAADHVEPGFYSALQRQIAAKMPAGAPAAQAKAIVSSGVTADEIKWSGVLEEIDRLAAAYGGKVQRADLEQYLRGAGAMRFTTTTLGRDQHRDAIKRFQKVADAFTAKGLRLRVGNSPDDVFAETPEGLEVDLEEHPDLAALIPDAIEASRGYNRDTPQPKFEQYTLPGGTNYREVILTMPASADGAAGLTFDELARALGYSGWHSTLNAQQKAEVERAFEAQPYGPSDSNGRPKQQPKRQNFTSGHFGAVPNYVAHMRLDDRQDAAGAEGALIEEIQSDRHQQGRSRGYTGDKKALTAEQVTMKRIGTGDTAYWESYDPAGDMIARHPGSLGEASARKEALNWSQIEADQPRIADAPFRKSWPLQMFKRALREAALSGKEWIGWTTGRTQADRYDLSKQVDAIFHSANGDGTFNIDVEKDERSVLARQQQTPAQLEEIVGKELAQKIVAGEGSGVAELKRLSGAGLKVGGEGMLGFYDKILPEAVGAYVKKWGGKVEIGNISTTEVANGARAAELARAGVWSTNETKLQPIWRVAITPQMRDTVKAGQPLFAKAPAGQEQRRYTSRVADDDNMAAEIRAGAPSYYVPETTKEWQEGAQRTINEQGLDKAMATVLATNPRSNPATAQTNALGLELVTRLQDAGRHEDAIAIVRHVAEGNTTQAQAIRAMGLYGKLDTAGAQLYAQKLVDELAQTTAAGNAELEQALKDIERLRAELAAARKNHATDAILEIQSIVKEAGWPPEKLADVCQKLRAILLQSIAEPGTARDRLRGILIAAGMERGKAERLAKRALDAFKRKTQQARDRMLKQMLKIPAPRQPVPKSQLEKWVALNDAGMLDDETLYGGIARKFGLPIFTREMAARIKEMQASYQRAPAGDLKLAAGARMMDEIHSIVPASFATKLRTIRNMAMLLNPKTIARNLAGNQVLMITDAAADTINGWVVDPLTSLFTGQRTRTTAAVMARAKGMAQPWRDFVTGREYGKAQGHTGRWQLFTDGLAHFRDMAKITNAAAWDVRHFRSTFRHVFTSRFGRMLEDALTVALGGGDRIFHSAAYQASLANQMQTAARNGRPVLTPAPAMLEQALLDANRAILQDENVLSSLLLKAQQAGNVIGIGKPIDPKTGKTKHGEAGRFGLGNIILPFAQIPGGAITRGIEFSPLGFVRAAYELLAPLVPRGKAFDQAAFTNAFTRALVGTGGYALGAWLLKLGVISALPDDDKDLEALRKASGLGGLRLNVSELKRRLLSMNFTPARSMFDAAQDGDLVLSYDWLQPAAFTIAAGAQGEVEGSRMKERAQITGKIPTTSSAMIAGLLGSTRGFEHMSVLNGLKRFATTTGQRESISQAVVEQVITLPASFVPTVTKDLNHLLDNTLRETRTDTARHPVDAAINAVLERIPMAAHFPPRFDAFGIAMERYQYGGNTLFNVMANPAFTTTVRKNATTAELERVFSTTLKAEVTPPTRDRMITVNGRQRELTNEELAQFKYTSGRAASIRLTQMLAAPAWAQMPDALKARYIGNAFSDAGTAAKLLLFGDRPAQAGPGAVGAAVIARRLGLEQPYPEP